MKTFIPWLDRLFAAERKTKNRNEFYKGYNWAAGCLLRGYGAEIIQQEANQNHSVNFDKGVMAACDDYHKLAPYRLPIEKAI